jgi:hypothetical protein
MQSMELQAAIKGLISKSERLLNETQTVRGPTEKQRNRGPLKPWHEMD